MCLHLESNEKFIAETDLVCYKIVYDLGGDNYETYFKHAPVELGCTYQSVLVIDYFHTHEVSFGLHSFSDYAESVKFFNKRVSADTDILFIALIECVIPKGSRYYYGMFAEIGSYASTKLRYVKLLFTNRI